MKWLWLTFLCPVLVFGQLHEILRPTVDVDASTNNLGGLCSPSTQTGSSHSLPNAYDSAGLSTSSSQTASRFTNGAVLVTRLFETWASSGQSGYTNLTLNINSSGSVIGGTLAEGIEGVAYSLNSGSTWNTVISNSTGGSGWSQQTSTFSISTSQPLSKIEVGICLLMDGITNGVQSSNGTITVWDIWTDGSYFPPPPPPGAPPPPPPTIPQPVVMSMTVVDWLMPWLGLSGAAEPAEIKKPEPFLAPALTPLCDGQ